MTTNPMRDEIDVMASAWMSDVSVPDPIVRDLMRLAFSTGYAQGIAAGVHKTVDVIQRAVTPND